MAAAGAPVGAGAVAGMLDQPAIAAVLWLAGAIAGVIFLSAAGSPQYVAARWISIC